MLVQSCQQCVFAKYNDKTQVGCLSGYLDKFQQKGCVKEAYNDAGEFFLIEGIRCPAYRDIHLWETPDLERLKRELVLNIDVFVLCHKYNTEEQIVEFVRYFENQIIKPRKVIVVLWENITRDEQGNGTRGLVLPSRLARKFQDFTIDIGISESVNPDACPHDAIDRILVNNDSNYYVEAFLCEDLVVREDFLSKVNSLVFDEFRNFIYITETPTTCNVVNTKLHKMMGGNRDGKSIKEKMIILSEQNMIGIEMDMSIPEHKPLGVQDINHYVLKGEDIWTTPA